MAKEIFLDFSGWIQVNPETRFQCTTEDERLPAFIQAKDWAILSESDRQHYVLESVIEAIRDSEDLEYKELDFTFGEEYDQDVDFDMYSEW